MIEVNKDLRVCRGALALVSLLLLGGIVPGNAATKQGDLPVVVAKNGSAVFKEWRVLGPFQGGTDLELLDRNLVRSEYPTEYR